MRFEGNVTDPRPTRLLRNAHATLSIVPTTPQPAFPPGDRPMNPTTRRGFLRVRPWPRLPAGPLDVVPPRRTPSPIRPEPPEAQRRGLLLPRLPRRQAARMDMFQFVDLAADMGLDAVEPTSYYFPPDVDAAYLHRLKQHAFVLGLDISGTSVGNNFCVPDGPERDKQLALVRTWVDHAAELDAPVIRIFAGTRARGDDRGRRPSSAPSRGSRRRSRTPPRRA